MDFTIKIINTPNHTLFPMGGSYTFTLDSEEMFQELYDLMHQKINELQA